MSEKCQFCDKPATYRINGWAEDGWDEGYVYQLACDDHIKSYEEWMSEEFAEPDERIHGLEYVEDIIPLRKPNNRVGVDDQSPQLSQD